MSLPARIMVPKAGQPRWTMEATEMQDHNGVLMMQRVLLAGTLGLAMARKAAAILEGAPAVPAGPQDGPPPNGSEGAVLRAILGAAPCSTCSTWRRSPPRSAARAEPRRAGPVPGPWRPPR